MQYRIQGENDFYHGLLGDAWWLLAQKLEGSAQRIIQQHAATWYERALPQLSGLLKLRVEKRMEPSADSQKSVDLLQLLDADRDTVRGAFEIRNGELVCTGEGEQRIEMRYGPPQEYDYEVVFTRMDGNSCVIQMLSKNSIPFIWVIGTGGGNVFQFNYLKGAGDFENSTALHVAQGIENGVRYRSVVQVRNDVVRSYLNGKLIKEWRTDYTSIDPLRPFWLLRDKSFLGIGTGGSRIIVHAAQVTEITGRAR